ncbi:hypothetical protein [Hymenobacter cellulosilyticus]|uniref:Uncharacterized protein n=1 Tax=Hymenobacter cellulosilyticus TaxID=2932248 RepID=A0A8T9Q6T1_9BACT|nr:hypothetical protein [Hymenobacter cellulosilyticus]UOQ72111.1 hypothetical protein MUN79_26685 [Hymenobacter cellulosilyticus]
MKKNKPEVRQYLSTDSKMRQEMRTMHGHYLTDLAAFTAFNPTFTAAFGQQWLAALEAAEQATSGNLLRADLREDTQTVESLMEQSRTQVQALFYYVEQAFPKNPGRLDQYGKKQYAQARQKHDKMRALLSTALSAATRDQDELSKHGFTAAKLATLEQLSKDLDRADTTQEIRKGANTEGSDDYVRLQNAAYSFGQQLSKAAKVAFATAPVKQKLYRLAKAEAPEDNASPKPGEPAK